MCSLARNLKIKYMRQPFSDNSPLIWTNWGKSEPNNADGNEHWWVSSTSL